MYELTCQIMEQEFVDRLFKAHDGVEPVPSPKQVCDWLNGLLMLLFPELSDKKYHSRRELEQHFQSLKLELFAILNKIIHRLDKRPEVIEASFVDKLPTIHQVLMEDATAILCGDPAAISLTEVIRTYPGFYAMAVHRLAHQFYLLDVPLIPRILSEYAHGKTGIDIHPGARIGQRFCIDHGTGVVIGETVEIGDDVKLYQGVTLGALSVKKEMAKTKRHPTIEDKVIIYAGATILGGNTVIGHDSIIGGNVWITQSVEPFSRIYYQAQSKVLVNTEE